MFYSCRCLPGTTQGLAEMLQLSCFLRELLLVGWLLKPSGLSCLSAAAVARVMDTGHSLVAAQHWVVLAV